MSFSRGATLLGIIGFFIAVVAIILTVANTNDKYLTGLESFIQRNTKTRLVHGSLAQSLELSNWIFGRNLFSWRALFWSIVISTAGFAISYFGAVFTTPWLGAYYKFVNIFNHLGANAITIAVILTALSAEYLYVTKTRFFLRAFVEYKIFKHSVILIILDLATTYLLFELTIPFIIITALYVGQIANPDIDISKSIVTLESFAEISNDSNDGTPHLYTYGNQSQFDPYSLSGYCEVAFSSVKAIILELYGKLRPYFIMSITSGYVGNETGRPVVMALPFTTFLLSAFVTTFWTVGWWLITGILVFIFRINHTGGTALMKVHKSQFVVYVAIIWLTLAGLITACVLVYLEMAGTASS